jgi:hypothetical protein
MVDGSQREVPPPKARRGIITANHEETGHFGVLKTTHRIGLKYWWKGRRADVGRVKARDTLRYAKIRGGGYTPKGSLKSDSTFM